MCFQYGYNIWIQQLLTLRHGWPNVYFVMETYSACSWRASHTHNLNSYRFCWIWFYQFYTFRGNQNFVFIIIAQFLMSAHSRMRFGLQIVFVCLYIALSRYYHCANLSEDIEFRIKHILSFTHYTLCGLCGPVCFQFTHFPCDDSKNIYINIYCLCYHHLIGSMNYHPLFMVRSWSNGMRCMVCFATDCPCGVWCRRLTTCPCMLVHFLEI